MCLAALAIRAVPGVPVVVVANRDESTARPAVPLHLWREGLVAGRDATGGGTWMGAARGGRWALVTNVRDADAVAAVRAGRRAPRSRGALPVGFLTSDVSPADYAAEVLATRGQFDPFNLIVGRGDDVWFASAREPAPRRLGAGVFGLSNATLDTPWPKTVYVRESLRAALADGLPPEDELLAILDDTRPAPDDELPQTGIDLDAERLVSAPRIVSPGYGTRVSTLLTLTDDGRATLVERTWHVDGTPGATVRLTV